MDELRGGQVHGGREEQHVSALRERLRDADGLLGVDHAHAEALVDAGPPRVVADRAGAHHVQHVLGRERVHALHQREHARHVRRGHQVPLYTPYSPSAVGRVLRMSLPGALTSTYALVEEKGDTASRSEVRSGCAEKATVTCAPLGA